MMSTLDLRGRPLEELALRAALPRAEFDVEAAMHEVRPIVEDVRHRGAAALRDLGERFDGVRPTQLRVPREVLTVALDRLEPSLRAALEESIRRARLVHADQRRTDVSTQVVPGGSVTERWVPVDRVGLYVPGGLAVYPSSVVMNVVPAQLAGVPSLAVASPPQRENTGVFEGYPNPTILATCALLGVDEVYAVGGAQAVAMFAFGLSDTPEDKLDEVGGQPATDPVVCDPVSMVTGPGNIWVVAAKRLLKGLIGIDAEAGPTEIAVLADDSADPEHVAADLVSQAEHDPLAAAVLVTDSAALAASVSDALTRRVAGTKHGERIATALAGRQSRIVLVDDIATGLAVCNAYAAEHLEIQTRDAPTVAAGVRNAGAVFVGPWAPVSLGDYLAGSNHVLPTAGCACHSSGLSVQSFLRGTHVVSYDEAALRDVARHVVTLAESENLPAHGEAVTARFADALPEPAASSGPPPSSGPAPSLEAPPASMRPEIAALLREDLRGLEPYGAPQLDVPVRLNTNENSYAVPEDVVAAIVTEVGRVATHLNRYPDREFTQLREALAAYLRSQTGAPVEANQVWAGNGSNEVLLHLVQAFGGVGRTALGFTPAYSMHPIITRTTGATWVDGLRGTATSVFDLDADLAASQVRQQRPQIVFLCSPNNPTGTALDLAVVEAVLDAAPDSLVVVDEAYAEFARPGTPSAMTLLVDHPLLVVTRTMSKAFALAGARVGYLAADPDLVDALRLVRMPYHLSDPTQAVALAAIRHDASLLATVEAVKAERDHLVAELAAMGFPPVPSDANFVLFAGLADEQATWQALLDHGVLVRDVGIPHHLRVTAGTPAESAAFLGAMADLPDSHRGRPAKVQTSGHDEAREGAHA